jgi:hypothetical protein
LNRKDLLLSLKRYVSTQRGEKLMASIGYAIGNDRHYDESCTLLFVTYGWLLQKLVFKPRFFDQCSHIFATRMISFSTSFQSFFSDENNT